ncbi:MAG: preprotein translocase subunit SecE [Lactococcus raffinolactis]|jgi:preprotein translocase subunit SecE|uniref:Preprotein translocase subunit SecE n=1 Tax=Pseudolactococcus raffinolactis TaxID=1366 RepID=A0A2A5SE47_9LACT|nr:preprotein translocase subunit SecE [Lactococcus raffinolactis]MBP6983963.1 preprotein translocase subunit SecE [Lactococcus sp.]ATC61142.1 preprotein translocase subunit SecE [Lactococcus raffinolactis]MBR2541686.1 preprotein translocase subunit SecE [Lactococcus sp.]MBW9298462.1 preprotein translocase subunit SecE [Lactococcus raffinolactis]MBW9330690.1 preprotein translocase subunit SecE [Lactococcus raffinolactis]
MFKFINSIVAEMRLVTWPTRSEAVKDFGMVIQYSIFFMVFIMIFDWLIKSGVTQAVKLLVPMIK